MKQLLMTRNSHSEPLPAPGPSRLNLQTEPDHGVLFMLEERNRRAGADPVIGDDAIVSQCQSLGPGKAVPRPPILGPVDVSTRMPVWIEPPPAIGQQIEDGTRD